MDLLGLDHLHVNKNTIITTNLVVVREFIYGISLIAVDNGKSSAYSMVFCKVYSIVLNNNEKQTL